MLRKRKNTTLDSEEPIMQNLRAIKFPSEVGKKIKEIREKKGNLDFCSKSKRNVEI